MQPMQSFCLMLWAAGSSSRAEDQPCMSNPYGQMYFLWLQATKSVIGNGELAPFRNMFPNISSSHWKYPHWFILSYHIRAIWVALLEYLFIFNVSHARLHSLGVHIF